MALVAAAAAGAAVWWLWRPGSGGTPGGAAPATAAPVPAIAGAAVPGRRVLFVGLDGMDWDWLEARFAAGDMPVLAGLAAEGIAGTLRSEEPLLSPLLWTTMMTGTSPLEHRILDFTRRNPGSHRLEPVTSSERRRPAIWNMATQGGRTVAVFGLWATWPAEPVRGTLVTDRLASVLLPGDLPPEGLAYPAAAAAEARETLREVDAAVDRAALTRLLPWLTPERYEAALAVEDPYSDPVGALRRILVQTEVYARLAARALERDAPDLTVLYLEGPDAVGHLFAPHLPGAASAPPEADPGRFGEVPAAYMRYLDERIGELVALARRHDAVLLFASDHGFRWADQPPVAGGPEAETAPLWHRPEGMYLLAGEGLAAPPGDGPPGTLRQVVPSLLALLGLPPAAGAGERPLPGIPERGLAPADYGAAYAPAAEVAAAPDAGDEELARLRALGYLGAGSGGDDAAAAAVEGTLSAAALANEALLLQQEGRLEDAARSLRSSLRLAPDRAATRTNLAILLTDLGRHREAAVILAAILEEEPDSPQGRLNLARSLSLAGRWEEAVSQYDELLRRYPDQPTFRLYRAAALREAGRPRQAAAAFREVVELLPQESRPRVEEAEALAAGGDFAAARERLEAGLAAQPRKGELLHALARLLAAAADPGVRDPERALSLARLVYDARPDPLHAETLAMALAASGRFAEAAELQARLAADGGGDDEARLRRRENLERYRAGRPAAPPW